MGTTHLDQLQISGVPTMGVNPLPLANNYWFVSSLIGSNGFSGDSYTTPFATLAFASSATNNPKLAAGDCIVVMEGHTETIASAAAIAIATAGVYVVGLGSGAYRPTFTWSTATTATWTITAASVTISNILCVNGIDQLAVGFSISAASCTLGTNDPGGYVEWQDPSSSLQTIRPVLTTSAADNLRVNMKGIGVVSGGTAPVNFIRLVGCNTANINLDFYGRASTAVVEFQGTVCTNIEIYGYMYNASNSASSFAKDVVDTATASTWFASFSDGWVGYDLSGGSGSALGPAQAATVIADLAVPSTDSTANLLERDVIGSKADAAVQAASSTASEIAYLKGILADVPKIAIKTVSAAGTTFASTGAVTLFTVTSDVVARVWATIQTTMVTTSNDGTLEVGVSGNTASFLPQSTMDGSTKFLTGTVWVDTSPGVKSEAFAGTSLTGAPIAGSANIIATVATHGCTAGAITFYCEWRAASATGNVVAA